MDLISELSSLQIIALTYLVTVNIVAFFYVGADKIKAQLQRRRTPEKTLWLMMIFGGTLGALLAMKFFRHKTRKQSFQAVVTLIMLLQIALVFGLMKM